MRQFAGLTSILDSEIIGTDQTQGINFEQLDFDNDWLKPVPVRMSTADRVRKECFRVHNGRLQKHFALRRWQEGKATDRHFNRLVRLLRAKPQKREVP